MKVLIINGSPHVDGCTATALKEVEKELNKEGIETETVNIGNKDIRGCIGCFKCKELKKCVFDDEVNEVAKLFAESYGILIGTPVYYSGMNGTLKAFLDRLFHSSYVGKTMKVGAAVISSRRAGSTSAYDEIHKYFGIAGMPIATSTYWNEVHGSTKEDVLKDDEGLQTMRNLGRNMAFLIKSINLGKKEYGLPERESGAWTNFIR
jgi:multimeric flavodoxin WrbA